MCDNSLVVSKKRIFGYWLSLLVPVPNDQGLMGNDHEVEFHEIEIAIFHEIEITIMRSKLYLFMRSKLTIIFSQFRSGG